MGFSYFNRLLISIGLLSASMIAYQLSLMQILSIVQWYHFAYMIIAIALLGFGGAGSFLALFRKILIKNIKVLLPVIIILSALFMPLSTWLSGRSFAGFDTYLLFVEQKEIGRLLLFELIFFIPFFFCALAIGMVFTHYTKRIGVLYFSNLIGSGLGGVLVIILFWNSAPAKIPFLTGILALLSSLLIFPRKARFWYVGTTIPILLLLFYLSLNSPLSLNISQYKSLSKTLDLPDTEIQFAENSPYGWVQYVRSPVLRYAPGLSLSYTGKVPVTDAIFNNGNWVGPVLQNSEDSKILDHTTSALALEISDPEKVFVLDAGTGVLSQYFSIKNIQQVHHVESNPLVSSFSAKETGFDESVKVYSRDSRSFLSETTTKYDLINLPDIGAFGGTAGLNALQENYLFTVEALELALKKLNKNGILSVTVWLDYPYRNPLKLTSSLVETIRRRGVERPEEHLMAVRSWNTITYILKNSPFTESQVQKTRQFCDRLSFDPLILPGISPEERGKYNSLQDESLFELTDILIHENPVELYKDYDFNIAPATDDRPYFSQFLKWKSFSRLQELFGNQSASFFELGYLIVGVSFLQSLLLSVLLIILPLFFLKKRFANKTWTILYFAGLGVGFMFVEMVLIQRFILLLGHPVYSVAAVITVLLFMSGLGSWYSSRLKSGFRNIRKILLAIAGILILYTLLFPWILDFSIGFEMPVKILIALLLIGFPAFFLGMPFPLGLGFLSKMNGSAVPWAWGINGCLSVISTSLATIAAIELGFTILLLLAALAYLISFGSCFMKIS